MKRLALCLTALAICAAAPSAAQADFGFSALEAEITDTAGAPLTQAGAHPHEFTTDFTLNTVPSPPGGAGSYPDTLPDGALKDLTVTLPPGFVGNATAVPTCSAVELFDFGTRTSRCPAASMVGIAEVALDPEEPPEVSRVYNLVPDPGQAAKLGFIAITVPVTLEVAVSPEPPFNLITRLTDAYQAALVYGSKVTIWGNPADDLNDPIRGGGAAIPERAFLTLPRSCPATALEFPFSIASWQQPGDTVAQSALTPAIEGCEALGFAPEVSAAPSTDVAESPAGFDFEIEIDDPGLIDPNDTADSDLKKAIVTLPEGLTVNPASANGLGACSEAQLSAESWDSAPGEGCPNASKVATVDVETPLLNERLAGSIFLATPYENPLGTLLAGYLVIKQPERGIAIKLAGKIETDPASGQITASFDQNPQLPFSSLQVSFKSGPHAPLTTPPTCGDYEIKTELFPWSGNAPVIRTDSFTIAQGPGGGPCARAPAELPHAPSFDAGSTSPISATHSPFVVNLRREDGSQRFSAVTVRPPPGLVAKLAGTEICPEGALAAAAAKAGKAEQAAPSCPPASQIGNVFAAAGSGPDPYWAPARAYLAGPHKGAPLSMAVIAPAVAGPFDLGTIVNRVALYVDAKTAEITAVSDPLPEILEGVPLDIRQISVRLDRPDFTLNGTSCDPLAVEGLLTSTLDALAPLHNRFQLSDCTRLAFKPRMTLRLKGPTKRSGHPALTIALRPRAGDANIASVSVALPRSE
ncbi:MAG TPA: hypothetical protein VNM89_01790, partial [Solirubrobacterales bacterium]|nr:hypothetical protein [Solirubrobacterales bacterium]